MVWDLWDRHKEVEHNKLNQEAKQQIVAELCKELLEYDAKMSLSSCQLKDMVHYEGNNESEQHQCNDNYSSNQPNPLIPQD